MKDVSIRDNKIWFSIFIPYWIGPHRFVLTHPHPPHTQMGGGSDLTACVFLVILFHYFSLTNFFWMLVEGKVNSFMYKHHIKILIFERIILSSLIYSVRHQDYICICWWWKPFQVITYASICTPLLAGAHPHFLLVLGL